MLDRFGNPVRVAWPHHHILWIDAALTLPRNEHTAAFEDIADLTGRSLVAIQSKAYAIQRARLAEANTRRVFVPGPAHKSVRDAA